VEHACGYIGCGWHDHKVRLVFETDFAIFVMMYILQF